MSSFNRIKEILFDRRIAVPSVLVTALTGAFLSSFDNRLFNPAGTLFDLQVSFSPELFKASVSLWKDHGTQLFLNYLQTDIVFCLCLTIMLLSVTGMMWTHLQSLYTDARPPAFFEKLVQILVLLPLLASAAGITGDLLFYSAVKNQGTVHTLIPAASGFALAKYLLLALSVTGIMILLVTRRRKMKSR